MNNNSYIDRFKDYLKTLTLEEYDILIKKATKIGIEIIKEKQLTI